MVRPLIRANRHRRRRGACLRVLHPAGRQCRRRADADRQSAALSRLSSRACRSSGRACIWRCRRRRLRRACSRPSTRSIIISSGDARTAACCPRSRSSASRAASIFALLAPRAGGGCCCARCLDIAARPRRSRLRPAAAGAVDRVAAADKRADPPGQRLCLVADDRGGGAVRRDLRHARPGGGDDGGGRAGPAAPLFARIFGAGAPDNVLVFRAAGLMSAFLDNAPTYLVFFALAGDDAARLTGPLATTLAAISAGACYFGGLTYLGNAPNLMVRAIVEKHGLRMPGFFGYFGWAAVCLVPWLLLVEALFFQLRFWRSWDAPFRHHPSRRRSWRWPEPAPGRSSRNSRPRASPSPRRGRRALRHRAGADPGAAGAGADVPPRARRPMPGCCSSSRQTQPTASG